MEPTVIAAFLYLAKLAQCDLPAQGTGAASGRSGPMRTRGLLPHMLASCAAALLKAQLRLRHPPASVIRCGITRFRLPCACPVLPATSFLW